MRVRLARLTFGQWLFVIVLLIGAFNFFGRVRDFLAPTWPIVQRGSDPEEQYRMQLGDIPYDVLRELDGMLPRDASILLVTDGHDVRHFEYTLFHRALYFLTPRAVWWMSPALSDGTWESNWWISAALSEVSIRRVADEKRVTHIVLMDAARSVDLGKPIARWGDVALVSYNDGAALLSPNVAQVEFAEVAWPLQITIALGVITALGCALLTVIGYRAAWYEMLALAWALGAGIVSLGMTYLGWLGVGLGAQIAILSGVAVIGTGIARWRVRGESVNQRVDESANQRVDESANQRVHESTNQRVNGMTHPTGALHRVVTVNVWPVLVLAMNVAFVVVLAVGRPLSIWDSWVTWGVKARTIFVAGGLSPAVYLDASRAVTHLDYPLMVPQVEAWTYGWLGAADDRFAGWQSIAFYLALLGMCYAALRRWGASASFALWVTAAVAALGPLALWSGLVFAEVQVAMLVLTALLYLINWLEGGSRQSLWIAVLAAGLLPWAKREGWVLLFVMSICIVAIGRDRRAWKVIGAMLMAALLIAGPWWLVVNVNGVVNTDFLPISLSTFMGNLDRLPVIARMMLSNLLDASWNLMWVAAALIAIGVAWLRMRARRLRLNATEVAATNILPLVAITYLAFMGLGFVFSVYVPYQQHVASSTLRLMTHVAPLPLMCMARRILRV